MERLAFYLHWDVNVETADKQEAGPRASALSKLLPSLDWAACGYDVANTDADL